MILYTMVPHEYIFPEDDSHFSTHQVVPCEDGYIMVEQINSYQYKVVRLISGNPMSYLNDKYTPGTIIQAKPQF